MLFHTYSFCKLTSCLNYKMLQNVKNKEITQLVYTEFMLAWFVDVSKWHIGYISENIFSAIAEIVWGGLKFHFDRIVFDVCTLQELLSSF